MNGPGFARIIRITEHVLGENGSPGDARCKKPVSELVGIESLGKARHMPGIMELDDDFPPRNGMHFPHPRIDREPVRDPAGTGARRLRLLRRQASSVRTVSDNRCSYLCELATSCVL